MHREATARSVWLGLEQQFLGNKETRALYLDAKFRNFIQGDLSITDYCRQLKGLADALGDLGEPVPDRTLVLNVLRGLNDKFSYMTALLKRQKPFPSFLEVRSDLLLEELTMANKSSASAFLAGTPTNSSGGSANRGASGQAFGGSVAHSGSHNSGGSRGNNKNRRRGRRGESAGSGNSSGGSDSSNAANSSGGSSGRPGWPTVYNPWTGSIQLWSGPSAPRQGTGLLGPRPALQPHGQAPQHQALVAGGFSSMQPPASGGHSGMQPHVPGGSNGMQPHVSGIQPSVGGWPAMQPPPGVLGAPFLGWDQNMLANSFNTMTLNPPANTDWYFDSGATSHMTSDAGNLSIYHPPSHSTPSNIIVGNGSLLPITSTGATFFPTISGSLHLRDVLVSPHIIKNLISVRQFTTDNNCSLEFDPFGVSVKDLLSKNVIARCNSSGQLYPLRPEAFLPHALTAGTSSVLWHRRLGHLGHEAFSKLASTSAIHCNKSELDSLCHACQLGRHTRLPFASSSSRASKPFDLIHCDLWTSPVLSVSGYKYYLVVLDDCTHYLWTFPLRLKSDTFSTLSHFFSYVTTQFGVSIKSIQCDNGREFDNSSSRLFFLTRGATLRMSCPYTSPQNGRAERIIRTTNNIVRSLLIQASLPPSYWVEALHTATYLLNRHPTKTLNFSTPFFALYGAPPSYSHLRVFGCKCYPNLSATAPHKLSPRSTLCVFLGYSPDHKGYRCLDLSSNRIIISRHVTFDESSFPFAESNSNTPSSDFDFLSEFDAAPLPPVGSNPFAGSPPSAGPAAPVGLAPQAAASRAGTAQASPDDIDVEAPVSLADPAPRRAAPVDLWSQAVASPTSSPSRAVGSPTAPAQAARSEPPATRRPPSAVPTASVTNDHVMVTRGKAGLRQPLSRMNLHAAVMSPLPKTYRSALADPNWRDAMIEEFSALQANHTWDLVPRPASANVVTGKWVFRHKLSPTGDLERYKARWVLRGFTQRPGIDFAETFSPVVKPATIRTVLTVALSQDWHVHQLDVKNAFLHGTLTETVYCAQPSGFVDPVHPDHVCRLNKSLYGLKQAPRAWYNRFASFILSIGFTLAKSDSSLFLLRRGSDTAYLLLYVDDIVLTASSETLLRQIISALQHEFSMKDLGPLHHFLGMSVSSRDGGLFLSQRQYILDILARANMSDCKPCSTPVDTNAKLASDAGPPVADPTHYRGLAGALQYLTFTRPDIAYAVQQVCLHMHDPREPHYALVKRILRYLKGTLEFGLQLHRTSIGALVAYSDADWAGCPDTRRSTSGYAVFLGDNLISWSSKRQHTVSRSSAEAEYRAVANAVAETSWLRQLLHELHCPPQHATVVYCDNISAVYLSTNPVQHQRTKHIEIDLHFVRDRVATGAVRVLHVPTSSQYADVFTKGLPSSLFTEFRSSLNVRSAPAPTAGAC